MDALKQFNAQIFRHIAGYTSHLQRKIIHLLTGGHVVHPGSVDFALLPGKLFLLLQLADTGVTLLETTLLVVEHKTHNGDREQEGHQQQPYSSPDTPYLEFVNVGLIFLLAFDYLFDKVGIDFLVRYERGQYVSILKRIPVVLLFCEALHHQIEGLPLDGEGMVALIMFVNVRAYFQSLVKILLPECDPGGHQPLDGGVERGSIGHSGLFHTGALDFRFRHLVGIQQGENVIGIEQRPEAGAGRGGVRGAGAVGPGILHQFLIGPYGFLSVALVVEQHSRVEPYIKLIRGRSPTTGAVQAGCGSFHIAIDTVAVEFVDITTGNHQRVAYWAEIMQGLIIA